VTAHPTAAWVWRRLIQAMPLGRQPKYGLRDRDSVSGRDFLTRAQRLGIDTLLTPFRAPRANALAERVVRTVRNECLDHVLVVNERHLEGVLREDLAYSNSARPHRSLGPGPPLLRQLARPAPTGSPGRVVACAVLGGLHHAYRRAA
jgi:transposase InsO family protein